MKQCTICKKRIYANKEDYAIYVEMDTHRKEYQHIKCLEERAF